jgi:hypothetical protein
MNFPIAPSFFSLVFTGIFVLFIFFLFLTNFKSIINLNYYQKIALLSLMTVAVGMHGLIHLGLEMVYGFNPLKVFNT